MEIIVKPGETLSQIALQHKVKQQDIVTLNKIPNANKIYAKHDTKSMIRCVFIVHLIIYLTLFLYSFTIFL